MAEFPGTLADSGSALGGIAGGRAVPPLFEVLFPGFQAITYVSYPLGFIAEFGLSLWLLIMGAKEQRPG